MSPPPAGSFVPSASPGRRPNLLLLVMDCVRSPEFSRGGGALEGMPFATQLGRESIEFTRAVAPASWTIPSHASLMTGLYPWDHGLHSGGALKLPEGTPTLARRLSGAGYRTASFSSNPFVSDGYGLTSSFDAAFWGGWWERYARHLRLGGPPQGRDLVARTPAGLGFARRRLLWPSTLGASRWALRHPAALHAANDVLGAVWARPEECPSCVSPWIEPSLRDWLNKQPAADPVFVFVNLMEAHEPYLLSDPTLLGAERRRARALRQDFGDWLEGRWTPSAEELRLLERLYVGSIRALDHRLRAIVDAFRSAGRWEETALVLTSDHGQGLGEEGVLSHGMSVSDVLTRVPLWLRLPNREFGGERSNSWASLVDVGATFQGLAGARAPPLGEGVDLLSIRSVPRSTPVWSMADGLVWPEVRARIPLALRAQVDRMQVAGYFGNSKVSSDGRTTVEVRRADGPAEAPPAAEQNVARIVAGLQSYLTKLVAPGASASREPSPRSSSRLESWGYV